MRGDIKPSSALISQTCCLPKLAPARSSGCRGFIGSVPQPLWMSILCCESLSCREANVKLKRSRKRILGDAIIRLSYMTNTQSKRFQNIPILSNVLLALLIIVLSLIVLSQANPGMNVPSRDYGIFSYIGQQIVLGKLPYKDAWDHKPPAVFYVDALGLWAAHGLRWGIWAIEFICLAAATWLSYLLIKKLWGVFPALCAVAIWTFGLNITLQGGNITEEFPLPLHFLALIFFCGLQNLPIIIWTA